MRTIPHQRGSSVNDVLYSVAEAADHLRLSIPRTRQLIASGRLASLRIGGRRYVPSASVSAFEAGRAERDAALRAAAPTEWDWEGNLVDTLSAWFCERGWAEVSRAEAAIREHGLDLVLEKDRRVRVIEVKGWPSSKHRTGPKSGQAKRRRSTMGRNYIGDLVLSAMILRSARPDDEVAIAVPDRETFVKLLDRIRSSLETLGVGAYVINEQGDVKPFVAIEGVDGGRVSRDHAVDRMFARRLVEMSDIQREAHFVSSNTAALEMIADAHRGR